MDGRSDIAEGEPIVDPRTADLANTQRLTVLLIEDDADHVALIEHGLVRHGFSVLSTPSGQRGFYLARRERPSVVLLDLSLPDGDGLAVCQRLTETPGTSTIPVILISGRGDQGIIRDARQAGGYLFLRKPFDPSALLVLINQAIEDRTLE